MGAVVTTHWLDTLGLQIYYRQAGESGYPLVLVHGGGSDHSGFSWQHTLPALGLQFRTYAPDLPGYGKSQLPRWMAGSEHPSARWEHYTHQRPIQYYVEFLDSFVRELGLEKFHLAGLSMGGAIAIAFALACPDRLGKLILVDSYGLGRRSVGGWPLFLASRIPLFNRLLRFALVRSRPLLKAGLKQLICNRQIIDAAFVENARRSVASMGGHPAWTTFIKKELGPRGYRTCFTGGLSQIAIPTLVIHGAQDPLFPLAWARTAAREMLQSQLIVFPDCGHLPPLEYPRLFNQLVSEFLRAETSIPRDLLPLELREFEEP